MGVMWALISFSLVAPMKSNDFEIFRITKETLLPSSTRAFDNISLKYYTKVLFLFIFCQSHSQHGYVIITPIFDPGHFGFFCLKSSFLEFQKAPHLEPSPSYPVDRSYESYHFEIPSPDQIQ